MKLTNTLIALLLTTSFGWAQGQKDPAALAILESMSKKYKAYPSFEASFVYTLIDPDGSTDDFSGTIAVKGDQYKLDLGAQLIINNGETVWTYLKEVNEVNVDYFYPEDQEVGPSNIFSIYEEGYKYVYVEETTDKNHVIDLEPEANGKDIYKIRMEIGANNDLNGFTLYERSGVKYKYTIDDFDGEVNLTDSSFVWNEKENEGVEIVDFRN